MILYRLVSRRIGFGIKLFYEDVTYYIMLYLYTLLKSASTSQNQQW